MNIQTFTPKRSLAACLTLFFLALPFLLKGFVLFQLSQLFLYTIALLGLNILLGYNGQISFGQGAFFAMGGYSTAILISRWHVPYMLAVLMSSALSFAFGFIFGLPAVRLEGYSLALATFSLAVCTPQILQYFDGWTGGSKGIVLSKPDSPGWLSLTQDQWFYLLCLFALLLTAFLASNLIRGKVGRALRAIRDRSVGATSMGVNVTFHKTMAFGISALVTGFAGALWALLLGHVAPESYSFILSVTFVIGIGVGGLGALPGAFYGALFILFIPNYTEALSKSLTSAIFGVVLLGFMYLMPTGVAGFINFLGEKLSEKTRKRRQAAI